MLVPCIVRVFKRTTAKTAAALDSSSLKWWQAPELTAGAGSAQVSAPASTQGTSPSRLLPPGLGLSVTAELGFTKTGPTVAERWPS